MGFKKITPLTLTDMFIQQVEGMILSGELAVGDKLPSVRQLSATLNVSLPVINAGIVELEKLGFVEVQPRKGAFVSDYRRTGSMETLVAIMRYHGDTMRPNEIEALFQVRSALDTLCIPLVCGRASDDALEALYPVLENIKTSATPAEAAEYAFKFHHELCILSRNALLPLIFYSFKPQVIYLFSIYCKRIGQVSFYEGMVELLRAILNRDSEGAVRRIQENMSACEENTLAFCSALD